MKSITSPVFADSNHQNSNNPVTTSFYLLETEDESDNLSPQPRSVCVKYSNLAWMECKGDLTLLGTSTHNGLSGKCTVKYYRSGTRIKCYSCGYSNTTTITDRHDCYIQEIFSLVLFKPPQSISEGLFTFYRNVQVISCCKLACKPNIIRTFFS